MFPHVGKHHSNVSVRRWWNGMGGRDCAMLYFQVFTAIRLGFIFAIARFGLLYRSEKLSIIKAYFKKEKKASLVLGLQHSMA